MKKVLLLSSFVILFSFISISQSMNCGSHCVLGITLDTIGVNSLNVTVYNGDSVFINYPSIVVVNSLGDTIGNINNLYFFFGQPAMDTMIHNIPTSLDSLTGQILSTVYITDNSSHQTCAVNLAIPCTVGINEMTAAVNKVYVFPNPATNIISIQSSKYAVEEIKIYNLVGELITTNTLPASGSGTATLDISNFTNGIYFIQVTTQGGIINRKLVKQ